MSIEIGIKVAQIDGFIEGEITELCGDTVKVKDIDGFYHLFLKSEIVVKNDELNLYTSGYMYNDMLAEKQEVKIKKKSFFKEKKKERYMEVDLHADKLIRSTSKMDNFEILNLQLDTAEQKLEFAIQKKIKKIIFIHGVGEGVLKSELNYLFNRFNVDFFAADYQKYGMGATEVVFK